MGAASCSPALDQFADKMPPAFRRLGELYIDPPRATSRAVERG